MGVCIMHVRAHPLTLSLSFYSFHTLARYFNLKFYCVKETTSTALLYTHFMVGKANNIHIVTHSAHRIQLLENWAQRFFQPVNKNRKNNHV